MAAEARADPRQSRLHEFDCDDVPPTYRGPACCVLCREPMDHARKLYSHLGAEHPEIVDARLALLSTANDVTRIVDISGEPRDRPSERVSGGGHEV